MIETYSQSCRKPSLATRRSKKSPNLNIMESRQKQLRGSWDSQKERFKMLKNTQTSMVVLNKKIFLVSLYKENRLSKTAHDNNFENSITVFLKHYTQWLQKVNKLIGRSWLCAGYCSGVLGDDCQKKECCTSFTTQWTTLYILWTTQCLLQPEASSAQLQ